MQLQDKIQQFKIKYPDRIPIILSRATNSDVEELKNNKFLVPKNMSVSQFISLVRKRLNMDHTKAIFMFVENQLPQLTMTVEELWDDFKDEDDILYFTYSSENTFGECSSS